KYKRLRDNEDRLKLDDLETAKSKYQAGLSKLALTEKAALDVRLKHAEAQEDLRILQEKQKNIDKLIVPGYMIDEALKQRPGARVIHNQIEKLEENIQGLKANGINVDNQIRPLVGEKKRLEESLVKLRQDERPGLERKIRVDMADEFAYKASTVQDRLDSLRK